MLPVRQENSTDVDEFEGVMLEEAERVLTLECFLLRIKRQGLWQRDGWGGNGGGWAGAVKGEAAGLEHAGKQLRRAQQVRGGERAIPLEEKYAEVEAR